MGAGIHNVYLLPFFLALTSLLNAGYRIKIKCGNFRLDRLLNILCAGMSVGFEVPFPVNDSKTLFALAQPTR